MGKESFGLSYLKHNLRRFVFIANRLLRKYTKSKRQAQIAKTIANDLGVHPDIHPDDFIFQFLIDNPCFSKPEEAIHYYFNDGRKSTNILAALVKELGLPDSFSLLEFASGYGCVSRHFPVVMPCAKVTTCDIHVGAVDFMSATLGMNAVISNSVPENIDLPENYDVIFSLSFFSHMPRQTWGRWLVAHFSQLKPGGALIFTTQGLESRKYFGFPEIPLDGFWYRAESEQYDLDTAEYGSTIVTRAFVENEVRQQIRRPIHLYRQGFWWKHQDLYVVRKPS